LVFYLEKIQTFMYVYIIDLLKNKAKKKPIRGGESIQQSYIRKDI